MVRRIYKVINEEVGWLPPDLEIDDVGEILGEECRYTDDAALCYLGDRERATERITKAIKSEKDKGRKTALRVLKMAIRKATRKEPKEDFDLSI